jgi:hypothetical protein
MTASFLAGIGTALVGVGIAGALSPGSKALGAHILSSFVLGALDARSVGLGHGGGLVGHDDGFVSSGSFGIEGVSLELDRRG